MFSAWVIVIILQSYLTFSSLAAIMSQWTLVVSTPSCRHSDIIFAVRNLFRCLLNYMRYLQGCFVLFCFVFWWQYDSFCCKTNVAGGIWQTPCDWKGLRMRITVLIVNWFGYICSLISEKNCDARYIEQSNFGGNWDVNHGSSPKLWKTRLMHLVLHVTE